MGQYYKFVCESCGYKTIVSGEPDRGLVTMTDTFVCLDCKEIFDLTIKTYSETNNKWTERTEEISCEKCKGHNLKTWHKEECPKCKSKMTTDRSVTFLWD